MEGTNYLDLKIDFDCFHLSTNTIKYRARRYNTIRARRSPRYRPLADNVFVCMHSFSLHSPPWKPSSLAWLRRRSWICRWIAHWSSSPCWVETGKRPYFLCPVASVYSSTSNNNSSSSKSNLLLPPHRRAQAAFPPCTEEEALSRTDWLTDAPGPALTHARTRDGGRVAGHQGNRRAHRRGCSCSLNLQHSKPLARCHAHAPTPHSMAREPLHRLTEGFLNKDWTRNDLPGPSVPSAWTQVQLYRCTLGIVDSILKLKTNRVFYIYI